MNEGEILQVASRSGATVAAIFFAVLLAVLGFAVASALRGRGASPRLAALAGALAFALPMSLVYAGSLSGFYEAETGRSGVTLEYLLPVGAERLDRDDVVLVEALPTFKSRWRVHLVLATGEDLYSAQTSRDLASRSAAALARQFAPGRAMPASRPPPR